MPEPLAGHVQRQWEETVPYSKTILSIFIHLIGGESERKSVQCFAPLMGTLTAYGPKAGVGNVSLPDEWQRLHPEPSQGSRCEQQDRTRSQAGSTTLPVPDGRRRPQLTLSD